MEADDADVWKRNDDMLGGCLGWSSVCAGYASPRHAFLGLWAPRRNTA